MIVRTAGLIGGVMLAAWLLGDAAPDFAQRNLAPTWAHPFGTDWMGRDMLVRVASGLSLSLRIGLLAAALSTAIALAVAGLSGMGRIADLVAGLVTDAMLSVPHLVLLILIAFALGGGTGAVIVAIAVSHWPRLARILRTELMQIRAAPYVQAARGFGRTRGQILRGHILPHLLPQAGVGFVLMFPHAILHEAGLTFLGFGLDPSRPAIGILLAEAMAHIGAGRWWLAVFPGAALLAMALSFEAMRK